MSPIEPHPAPTPEQARAARESTEKAAKAAEAAAKGVDDRLAAKKKSVDEYYERKANEQPTPTQRECDLAKVGALVDEKEDDGSESPEEMQQRIMEGSVNNPYVTRDMSAERRKRKAGGSKR